MTPASTVIERPNGGRARAAVSFQPTWLYFRATHRDVTRRTDLMLPDPATRPVVTADEAFDLLGIDRGTGYKAIRDGTFPVPIIRVGRSIRVPTAALRRILDLEGHAQTDNRKEVS